jgi:hypothetical protein
MVPVNVNVVTPEQRFTLGWSTVVETPVTILGKKIDIEAQPLSAGAVARCTQTLNAAGNGTAAGAVKVDARESLALSVPKGWPSPRSGGVSKDHTYVPPRAAPPSVGAAVNSCDPPVGIAADDGLTVSGLLRYTSVACVRSGKSPPTPSPAYAILGANGRANTESAKRTLDHAPPMMLAVGGGGLAPRSQVIDPVMVLLYTRG